MNVILGNINPFIFISILIVSFALSMYALSIVDWSKVIKNEYTNKSFYGVMIWIMVSIALAALVSLFIFMMIGVSW